MGISPGRIQIADELLPVRDTRYAGTALFLNFPDAFATWLAMKSMRPGDRQSYGSRPSCFSFARTAPMLSGSAPDSMIDETKAATSGGDQPSPGERSALANRTLADVPPERAAG